ncbi:MAG: hypothetical protein EBU57_03415 [Alphaproteobacteria bacterium]|nr:hypothetical protein [Alphaproteobacteria bacterium]
MRATDEGVSQALSNWRPTVQVSGSYGWERSDSTTSGPAAKEAEVTEPVTGTLTVTQNLYRGGRTIAATEEAENNVKADRARLSSAEQSVLLSAATAYADVVRDQAVLDLSRNNERVLQRQLEATQDRFGVGEVTRTDVSQAESRLSRARADRISAEGNLTDSRAAYENAVGVLPGILQAAKPLTDLPASLQESIERAKTVNYGVIQTRYIEKAAQNNVREITGELLPTLTLNGSAQTAEETSTPRSESQTLSVTAQVSMPLSAEIALEGVREEANVGSRTVLDVLDAEQELLDARVGLVRAMRDELVATYQLRQAVGELTAAKLGLPVELYNPENHYRRVRGKWWGLTADDGK